MEIKELNLNDISGEMQFLIGLNGREKGLFCWNQIDNDFNWSLFLDLVVHHRLFPGLAAKIERFNIDRFPANILAQLKHWQRGNTFQMLQLFAEMDQLNRLLVEKNISTIFLKGPILAIVLYGDVSLRTSSDLDLLVPIKDLKRTEDLLTQTGYIKDDYIDTVLNDWTWRHHHITFYHPEKKVKVEVHWRLNPGPGKEPSFNLLWGKKQKIAISNEPIYFLGYEDLLYFLITHGARHGWSRLRWLLDIHQLLQKPLDWEVIKKTFKTYNNLPLLGQALILSNQLLKSHIKEPIKLLKGNEAKANRLAGEAVFYLKQMINLHSEGLPEEISRYHKRHLIFQMSFQQKLLFFLSTCFPYPEDALILPLPKYLHFLYIPLRPFTWFLRTMKKNRSGINVQGVEK